VAGPGGGGGGTPGGGPPVPKNSPTLRIRNTTHRYCTVHVQDSGSAYNKSRCKKRLTVFPSPAGMSLSKLSLAGNN
jgi:hypothetical protein